MERLRQLREEKRMTQLRLALELNMSQQRISKLENGQADLPASILVKIAKYFNVSIDYLLELTDCRTMNIEEDLKPKTDINLINLYKSLEKRDQIMINKLLDYYTKCK